MRYISLSKKKRIKHTRGDRSGKNGFAINTLWSAERLTVKRLSGLEVECRRDRKRSPRMGSKTPIELRSMSNIANKH
jgi:hypothetical protein